MADLTSEQRQQNLIAFGRATVKIVEGADYLYPDSRRVERVLLKAARLLYRMQLREFVATLPPYITVEVLATSDRIKEPIGDVNLN